MVVTALALLATKYTLRYYPEHKNVYHCNFICELFFLGKQQQKQPTKNQTPQNPTPINNTRNPPRRKGK